MNGDPITKEEIDYIKEKIKSLETNLALSEKKLDRAMEEIKEISEMKYTTKDSAAWAIIEDAKDAIKEIEEME